MDDRWERAWVSALDALELSVERAEELLRSGAARPLPLWQPPTLDGPPPPQQLERAHLLLQRHLRVSHDLAQAMTATRQQLALTAKVSRNRPHDTPVYVDVTA